MLASLASLQVELWHELVPKVRTVGWFVNPNARAYAVGHSAVPFG